MTERGEVRVAELVPGGPAAKLGYVGVGDVVVAVDEQPIPPDIPAADLHAFVLSRGEHTPPPAPTRLPGSRGEHPPPTPPRLRLSPRFRAASFPFYSRRFCVALVCTPRVPAPAAAAVR